MVTYRKSTMLGHLSVNGPLPVVVCIEPHKVVRCPCFEPTHSSYGARTPADSSVRTATTPMTPSASTDSHWEGPGSLMNLERMTSSIANSGG